MANRVVYGAQPGGGYGLRISKPGVNVLAAGPGQLQFSSDWSQVGLLLTNELDCDWNESAWRTYDFGKTFPTAPLVHFQRVINAGEYRELSCAGAFLWQLQGATASDLHVVQAEATTTAIRIKSLRTGTSPTMRLRYTVMDYNL